MADTYKALADYLDGLATDLKILTCPESEDQAKVREAVEILRRLDAAQGAVDGVMTRVIAFEACSYDPEAGAIALQQVRASVEDLAIGQQWRPISEAPKDGKKIILRYLNRNNFERHVFGCWLTQEQAEEHDADGVGLEAGWYECIENWPDYTEVTIHEGEPSRWLPLDALPPAPKEPTA